MPHVQRLRGGQIQPVSSQLVNPAFLVELRRPHQSPWRGWYLLREGAPEHLATAGFTLRPLEPISHPVSLLTAHLDPGAPLAMIGGVLIALGASVAMFSYYVKRKRGEHPDVS